MEHQAHPTDHPHFTLSDSQFLSVCLSLTLNTSVSEVSLMNQNLILLINIKLLVSTLV